MYGPVPAAPVATLIDLVSVTTALLVAVVVSVLDAVLVPSPALVAVTPRVFVCPAVAVAGTVPVTMNLKVAPAASAPLDVMAEPVGVPLPLSAKICTLVMLNCGLPLLAAARLNVSVPLPVLVRVCG